MAPTEGSIGGRAFVQFALGLVALGLYAPLLLVFRITLWHDALVFPVVLWLALRAIGDVESRRRWLAPLALMALSLGLAYVWRVGFGGRNQVFAGVFALSDAGEYYWDAERVLHGALMDSGGARRPIFSAVLAGLLRLSGNNIRLAHVVTMALWAGSGAFAVSEVWRTHGHRAGAIVFVLFVLFARRYVGFVQSEGLGAPLGALAFALLWRANSMKIGWHTTYLGAVMLQSVALLARPGPMFVLPAILLWGGQRAEKGDRLKLLLQSIGVVAAALALQHFVRVNMTRVASFSDLAPILYGLLHGEDSQYVFAHNRYVGELAEPARTSAIWALLRSDVAQRPALALLAPVQCLASWFYLPQGFFGFVWLNPDDRAVEDAQAVRQSIAVHGLFGPLFLWVRTLGLYSLCNALSMATGALLFLVGIGVASVRAWRARRSAAPPFLVPILLGVFVSLPFLPPWITEGAQILASVFFYVVAFVVTSYLPPRLARVPAPYPRAAPLAGPAVLLAISALVGAARLFPRTPPAPACGVDGRHALDVDPHGAVTYGMVGTVPALADLRENVVAIAKHQRDLARALAETLLQPHRIFPAYDACRARTGYVLEDYVTEDDPGAKTNLDGGWTMARTVPEAAPLERLCRSTGVN